MNYIQIFCIFYHKARVTDFIWNYICLLNNLFNREIVGYSVGAKKDANLVYEAFMNSTINLSKIKIFHTDRGNEFKNKIIDEVLKVFNIERSLSKKGMPLRQRSSRSRI